jgi:hypothetical protein
MLRRAHWRFYASETPTAPGQLKRSKLSGAMISAWLLSDVLIHSLAKELLYYIHHMHLIASSTDTGHATRNGNDTVEIFLLRQSDIGTDTGIILMKDAKDCRLLRARGQWLDSVLFSQSDNRHITTSTWTVPRSFTTSFPSHFTCFVCIWSEPRMILDIVNTLCCEDKEW